MLALTFSHESRTMTVNLNKLIKKLRAYSGVPACRSLLTWIVCLAVWLPAAAADYPQWPVKLMVQAGPNSTDWATAQAIAQQLNSDLDFPIEPDDRSSKQADAVFAALAKARPAGQLLLLATASQFLTGSDSGAQLLGVIETSPMVCAVNTMRKVTSMEAFINGVKSDGNLRVASAGKHSQSALMAQISLRSAGLPVTTKLTAIAFNSPAAAVAAVLTGAADYACAPFPVVRTLLAQKQLIALVASSAMNDLKVVKPMPASPDLSLLDSWYGVAGPPRLDAIVIDRWQTWLTRLSRDPVYVDAGAGRGVRIGPEHLMLRAQAQAEVKKRRAAILALAEKYGFKQFDR